MEQPNTSEQSRRKSRKAPRENAVLKALRIGVTVALQSVGELTLLIIKGVWAVIGFILGVIGKFSITTWRLAGALDSALWRALKHLVRRLGDGLMLGLALLMEVFRSLILWLPTRTGRAYSAMSGVAIVVCGLWIADLLREGEGERDQRAGDYRAPLDEQDPILARIGGRFVHLSEIEAAARAGGVMGASEALTSEQAFERGLVESYVEQRLLARSAEADGVHRDAAVRRRVNTARDRILASALLQARLEETVTAEVVERYYREQRKITQLGDQVRAKHILVDTEEEALEIVALLEEGAEFSQLARARSQDRATAPLRGEIGWFSRGQMTRRFSNVAFRTPVGTVSKPFKTQYGWHIVKVTGRRPTTAKPFEDVKDEIEEFLRNQTIARLLSELEDANRVVYYRPEPTPPATIAPLIVPRETARELPQTEG